MTRLEPQAGAVPRPVPSAWSEPYWEGCRAGELRFQRCGSCGGATHTPAAVCSHCGEEDLSWEASSGQGAIYSWSTVWRPQTPEFEAPYVAVVVEMDEDWFLLSNLIGCEHDAVHIGMRVRVDFRPIDDDVSLPYVTPTDS